MDKLRKLLRQWLLCPEQPGQLYVFYLEQVMTMFKLRVLLPAFSDSDVNVREFSYKINDADAVVVNLTKDTVQYEFVAERDAKVSLSLVDIDLSGNRSPASTRDFTVVDTFAPRQPGEIGIEVIEQFEV